MRIIPGLGPEYVYVKSVVLRAQTIEEDLRAVLAQYTEDETTIKLFQATKLTRFLQTNEEFVNPRQVEIAAYRLLIDVLSSASTSLSENAVSLLKPYILVPVVRDVELVIRRAQRGETPSREELFWPENKLVQETVHLVEEGIIDPAQILRRIGLRVAYDIITAARSAEALSTALDVELMNAFTEAFSKTRSEIGREILGGRLDIYAAKTMFSLIEMKPPRQAIDTYMNYLTSYKLSIKDIRNVIESFDQELAKRLLTSSKYGNLSENLSILEGFIAKVRKHLRKTAKKIFTWEPVTNESIIGTSELILLDVEDAIIIALLAYSRQPKQRVVDALSFT